MANKSKQNGRPADKQDRTAKTKGTRINTPKEKKTDTAKTKGTPNNTPKEKPRNTAGTPDKTGSTLNSPLSTLTDQTAPKERRTLNGGTLLGPLPCVMVTCGSFDEADIVTVAWTGITSTKPPTLYISLRPERHSHKLITASGEFVVNLVPSELARACDWCGMYSGRDRDKFADCPTRLTKTASQKVACPTLAESPLSLECRVLSVTHLGSHDMFLASIECVTADESLFDEKGRLCLERADLLSFTHGEYYAQGAKKGDFGFTVRKKAVRS